MGILSSLAHKWTQLVIDNLDRWKDCKVVETISNQNILWHSCKAVQLKRHPSTNFDFASQKFGG